MTVIFEKRERSRMKSEDVKMRTVVHPLQTGLATNVVSVKVEYSQ